MKLYYETEELCRKSFPNAIKIEPCNDSSFIEFVNKIKELSNEILFDYKGREIWVISTPYGDVLYRQYAGEDKSFIDGCEYQIHNFRLVEPVLWSISNPKDFYQDILTSLLSQQVYGWISPKEGEKRKIKRRLDKNGYRYFTDRDDNLYIINKCQLPTKRNNANWEKYHDTDAVFVRYGTGVKDAYEWFENIDTFLDFWETHKSGCNPAFGTPRYKIVRSARTLKDKNELKSVLSVGKCPRVADTHHQQIRQWAYGLREFVHPWEDLIPILENATMIIR